MFGIISMAFLSVSVPVSSTSIPKASKGSKNKDFLVPLLTIVILLLLGLLIFWGVRSYKRSRARRHPAGAAQDNEDGEEGNVRLPLKEVDS